MQREFPRYASTAVITIRNGDAESEGRTANVSRGGLCAQVPMAVPVGSQISVDMKLVFDGGGTSDALSLPARVVWATALDDGHQVGLAFRALSGTQTTHLDRFLSYLEAGDSSPDPKTDADDLFGGCPPDLGKRCEPSFAPNLLITHRNCLSGCA